MDELKKNQEQQNEGNQTPNEAPKQKVGTKVKAFFSRNAKKFVIGGLAGAGIVAGILVKKHRDEVRAAEAEDEAERTALAEEWYERGLAAGQGALPEPTEADSETNEEES